jgi:hypothetical protein
MRSNQEITKIRELNAIADAAWKRYDAALMRAFTPDGRRAALDALAEARRASDEAEALLDSTGMGDFRKSFGMM